MKQERRGEGGGKSVAREIDNKDSRAEQRRLGGRAWREGAALAGRAVWWAV